MNTPRPFRSAQVPKPNIEFRTPPPQMPLHIEIGAGVGTYAIRHAQANPDHYYVAIEHGRARYTRFQNRLQNHPPLVNLQAVHADAVSVITHCIAPASVDHFYILYPNPNPKNRSRRWVMMPFFEKVMSCLRPGGGITLATNIATYCDEARAALTEHWHMDIVHDQRIEAAQTPLTNFEKKYLEAGQTCFHLQAKKPHTQAVELS